MARPLLDTRTRYSLDGVTNVDRCLDDAISVTQKQKIKKAGKAAIRGALARLAGDAALNSLLTNITIQSYQSRNLRSFEDYILATILESGEAEEIFGAFAGPRDILTDGPDLRGFLRAKNGDENYLSTVAFAPGAYQRFIYGVLEFLREVQTATIPAFVGYTVARTEAGAFEEVGQRISNVRAVLNGNPLRPGLRGLSTNPESERFNFYAAAANYSEGPGGTVTLHVTDGPPPGGPAGEGAPGNFAAAGGNGTVDSTDLVTREFDSLENTAVDFTLPGGASSELSTTLEGVPITDLSSLDNGAVIDAAPLSAPTEVPDFLTDFLVLFTRDGANYELLRDWPATPDGRPRSPRYVLGSTDSIRVAVYAPAGGTGFEATVTGPSDTIGFSIPLTETSPGSGIYQGDFRVSDNPTTGQELAVIDEEVVRIDVNGPGLSEPLRREIMVDYGELAIATVKHLDRTIDQKPRFDYVEFLLNRADGPEFGNAGFVEFDDDVAAVTGGGDNPMRRFIQAFGDPSQANNREADLLYVHAHGGRSGQLADHISDDPADAGFRAEILDPVPHLSSLGLWRTDAEFFISEACLILTDDSGNAGQEPGADRWTRVLTNSPRPIHGILGFARTKSASRAATRDFLFEVINGVPLRNAWQAIMTVADKPWGTLFFQSATNDSIFEVSQDPLPGDRTIYLNFIDAELDECEDPEGDCGPEPTRTEFQPGWWIASGTLLQTNLPVRLPHAVRTVSGPVLGGAARIHGDWAVIGGRETLVVHPTRASPITNALAMADPVAHASAYLTNLLGFDPECLQHRGTGHIDETVLEAGKVIGRRTAAQVVRFGLLAQGLPVFDTAVTVKMDGPNIREILARARPRLVFDADVDPESRREAVRPAVDCLSMIQARVPGGRATLDAAELGWKVLADGRAVPVWRFHWRPASANGVPAGGRTETLVHATRGEILEVTP
jgi:hypothetical protein